MVDQVKDGGFSGAVWSDQTEDFTLFNLKTNAVDRGQAPEIFYQVPGFKDDHESFPLNFTI